jgi:hypothetical protein
VARQSFDTSRYRIPTRAQLTKLICLGEQIMNSVE